MSTPLLESFSRRATRAGAVVQLATSDAELSAVVSGLIPSSETLMAVVSPDLGPFKQLVCESLLGAGAKLIEDPSPYAVAQAQLGVSRALLGVAETGSILIAGNDLLPRMASMLPTVHVAILDQTSIVAGLAEVGERLRSMAKGEDEVSARYASLITGPSRTADVEKTLSIGVHGPRELHIVLVKGTGVAR